MRRRATGAVLSCAVSLAVALVLAARLSAPSEPARPAVPAAPQPERPSPESAASLALAKVRLPPPPEAPAPPRAAVPETMLPPPPAERVTALRPTRVRPRQPDPPPPVRSQSLDTPTLPPPAVAVPPAPETREIAADAAALAEGRALLRLLEHGRGPQIEIAWPESAGARERLFRYLRGCAGMRVGVKDGGDRFYLDTGATGLDLDRYSGFMRTPTGRIAAAERRLVARIRAGQGGLGGVAIRLFPRSVDAALLGGLRQAAGDRYAAARTIRARYWQAGDRLYVTRIRVDGRPVPGRILLTRGCRA